MKTRINFVFELEIRQMAEELKTFLGCASLSEVFRYVIRREYQAMVEWREKLKEIEKNEKDF